MTLRPKQRKALEALIISGEVTQAATAAGVSRETVYKWLKEPEFKAALSQAESEAIGNLSRALVMLGEQATETLRAAMSDNEAPAASKVRAADIVLDKLLKLRTLFSLEERITRLEAITHEKG